MTGVRHASKRKKKDSHRKIHPATKELVVQYREMGMTYNAICDKTNLGYGTVEYICTKWAPSNPEPVKAARARALEQLAAKVNEKALLAIEHITPDSLTHDRIEHYDDSGKLVGVSHSGPTGQQIALTAGILLDKVTGLENKAAVLRGEQPATLGPDSFATLLSSIQGRVTKLTELRANLDLSGIQARIVEFQNAIPEGEDYAPVEYTDVQDAEYEEQ